MSLSPDCFYFSSLSQTLPPLKPLNGSSLNSGGVNCSLSGAHETGLWSNDARSNQEVSSSPSHTRGLHLSLDLNLDVLTGSKCGRKMRVRHPGTVLLFTVSSLFLINDKSKGVFESSYCIST